MILKSKVNDEDLKGSYKVEMVRRQNNNEDPLPPRYDISSLSTIYSELPPHNQDCGNQKSNISKQQRNRRTFLL
ncbi:MAG: hypothetical protein M3Y53_08470 [Thermoproteota archaeon]|nr:hypothetical protein [Thermoproteota archaeon]